MQMNFHTNKLICSARFRIAILPVITVPFGITDGITLISAAKLLLANPNAPVHKYRCRRDEEKTMRESAPDKYSRTGDLRVPPKRGTGSSAMFTCTQQWAGGMGLAGGAAVLAALIGMASASADPLGGAVNAPDTNDALVLIPAENAEYADTANALYLAPNGFDGNATVFLTPDQGNEVANVAPGVQALVQTIEADYNAGDLSAADPLYVFGYSEGAVEEGLAEQQLAADGIPSYDLNFVMVGDSASAEGGYLNTVIDSLPESLQQPTTQLFAELGLTPPLLGATTPDDLYPTEVYSFTGDGWTNWDGGANSAGMFTEHLAYLGLTPAEIASATETTDGMTDYYTIDSSNVDFTTALYNQLLLALDVSPSAGTDSAASAATASPDDVIGQAITDLNQGPSVLATASTTDLGSRSAEILASQESLPSQIDPILTQMESLQDQLAPGYQYLMSLVDEQLVSAAQGVASADQVFAAADQAGELSGSGWNGTDLTVLAADLNLAGAGLDATGAGILADLTGGLDASSAADLASSLDPSAAIDPGMFTDLLSSIGL
jgi:hypothetical protein